MNILTEFSKHQNVSEKKTNFGLQYMSLGLGGEVGEVNIDDVSLSMN